MISEVLESVIRYARNKMLSEVSEMDEQPAAENVITTVDITE